MNELLTNTLIDIVRDMRQAQIEYFKTRSKESLLYAKRAEQKVDSFIRSVSEKHNLKPNEEKV